MEGSHQNVNGLKKWARLRNTVPSSCLGCSVTVLDFPLHASSPLVRFNSPALLWQSCLDGQLPSGFSYRGLMNVIATTDRLFEV